MYILYTYTHSVVYLKKNEVGKIYIIFYVLKGQCNSKAEFSAPLFQSSMSHDDDMKLYADLVLKKHFLLVYHLSSAYLFI